MAGSDDARNRTAQLARTIENEVVPRLLLSRRAANADAEDGPEDSWVPGEKLIGEFAVVLLGDDPAVADEFVGRLAAHGMSVEHVYLELLAPAARHLGDLWCSDLCSFAEVTLGLARLQRLLHELSPAFHNEVRQRDRGRRIMLIPVNGENHTFGLSMVVEFFRRAGWDVWSDPTATVRDISETVRQEWFAVVGISISSESRIGSLSSGIRTIRRASRNRSVGIMVGGPLLVERPELATLVGADATAEDGRRATVQAENLLELLAGRT